MVILSTSFLLISKKKPYRVVSNKSFAFKLCTHTWKKRSRKWHIVVIVPSYWSYELQQKTRVWTDYKLHLKKFVIIAKSGQLEYLIGASCLKSVKFKFKLSFDVFLWNISGLSRHQVLCIWKGQKANLSIHRFSG